MSYYIQVLSIILLFTGIMITAYHSNHTVFKSNSYSCDNEHIYLLRQLHNKLNMLQIFIGICMIVSGVDRIVLYYKK